MIKNSAPRPLLCEVLLAVFLVAVLPLVTALALHYCPGGGEPVPAGAPADAPAEGG